MLLNEGIQLLLKPLGKNKISSIAEIFWNYTYQSNGKLGKFCLTGFLQEQRIDDI